MKIRSVECWEVKMPLKEPYTIAYETIHETVNVFMCITTDTGIRAYGCAAPDLEVTGETPAGVISAFNNIVEPLLHGHNLLQIALITELVKKEYPHSPSLLAMVDMALYDLLSKTAKLPLYLLLGGYRHFMPTSITIGILPVNETIERASDFIRQGFFILKVKGGHSVEMDVERMHAIREKFGKDIQLRFDANQGYSVEDAVRFVRETKDCNIEILEQPSPKGEWAMMGHITEQVHLPVMADEGLMNLSDAHKIAKNNWADMINIKLMKVGGIRQAMHINSVAKAAGMESMVGCMDESALGIAAGLHFALSRPNVEYADLDGHLDLIGDPANCCILLKEGVLYPKSGAGLGFIE
ncbi:MAG: dipeptide epimerase [Saprospiraceae bacterium]